MPLLLQIGLAVKGIDCEPEPQLGLKRRKLEMEGVGCYQQVICRCLKKHALSPSCKVLFSRALYSNKWGALIYLNKTKLLYFGS